jgi:hypothetical protein
MAKVRADAAPSNSVPQCPNRPSKGSFGWTADDQPAARTDARKSRLPFILILQAERALIPLTWVQLKRSTDEVQRWPVPDPRRQTPSTSPSASKNKLRFNH